MAEWTEPTQKAKDAPAEVATDATDTSAAEEPEA